MGHPKNETGLHKGQKGVRQLHFNFQQKCQSKQKEGDVTAEKSKTAKSGIHGLEGAHRILPAHNEKNDNGELFFLSDTVRAVKFLGDSVLQAVSVFPTAGHRGPVHDTAQCH